MALADLKDAARFRSAGGQDLENGWSGTVIANLNHHLFWGHPFDVATFSFLGLPLGAVWIVVALVFLTVAVLRVRSGLNAVNLLGRWTLMGLIGLVPSCAWYIVMAAHTHHHFFLYYRHLILSSNCGRSFWLFRRPARSRNGWAGGEQGLQAHPFDRAAAVGRHA